MSRDKDRNVNKPLKFRQNLYFAIGIIKEAKPVIGRSVLLSAAGVVLTAGITGLFIHLILKLPLLESLLTASVIGSTDAASVFGILRSKNLNLKENTASLLEMESGSNDPISYMLTVILTGLQIVFILTLQREKPYLYSPWLFLPMPFLCFWEETGIQRYFFPQRQLWYS